MHHEFQHDVMVLLAPKLTGNFKHRLNLSVLPILPCRRMCDHELTIRTADVATHYLHPLDPMPVWVKRAHTPDSIHCAQPDADGVVEVCPMLLVLLVCKEHTYQVLRYDQNITDDHPRQAVMAEGLHVFCMQWPILPIVRLQDLPSQVQAMRTVPVNQTHQPWRMQVCVVRGADEVLGVWKETLLHCKCLEEFVLQSTIVRHGILDCAIYDNVRELLSLLAYSLSKL
mmetsp:Transcript_39594/g.126939  ORF Transcript_39594/g.126939 Transcript_39594/m.126939 type:complete len:227 (-) Transcript_39594:513-1193(-)